MSLTEGKLRKRQPILDAKLQLKKKKTFMIKQYTFYRLHKRQLVNDKEKHI